MRQLFHIFKKDIRGLWGELAVFLCSLVLACLSFLPSSLSISYTGLEGEILALITGCYLIACVIHTETIPGSSHFWLTRPYRWPALVGAKALFIFVSVHLPVFIAQAALLRIAGFPVWENLPALLWMQVLVLGCLSLPVAAVAAVTTGLAGFSLFIVGVLASGVAVVFFRGYVASGGRRFVSDWVPSHVGWVSYAILAVALTAAALPVLLAQYSWRRTSISRLLLGGILLIGLVLSLFAGGSLTWTIQALASTRTLETASFQFSLGTPTWMAATTVRPAQAPEHIAGWPPASFEETYVDIRVPLLISGMDPGIDIEPENVSLSFEAPDGESSRGWMWMRPLWDQMQGRGGVPNPFHRSRMWLTSGSERRLDLSLSVFGKFYEKLRNKPSTVRGYIDLFVIGNERSLAVPRTSFPVNVTSAFRCGLENLHREKPLSRGLKCHAALRWPFQSIEVGAGLFISPESFSPFPASLRLNPIEDRQPLFDLPESPQVDFNLREPVSFVRKEFEIRGVQLIEGPATVRGWGIER